MSHLLKRLASRCLRRCVEVQRLQDLEQSLGKAMCIDSKWYSSSNLPEDIARAARQARYPDKQFQQSRAGGASPGSCGPGSLERDLVESGMSQAASSSSKDVHNSAQEAAAVATNWMFPWERRQMQGGSLSSWEKLYWGVFVVAISVFLFNRAGHFTSSEKDGDGEAEAKELEKQKRARLVLAGASMLDDEDDDPFEGLTPKEIQDYVEEYTGANSKDPFEGMSPEEINEFIKANGI
eukprot:jgi/Picsp_1/2287/NSC_05751-R1_protein